MFKNSKAPLIVTLIVSFVLIFSLTSYFVLANVIDSEVGDYYFEDYKVVRYDDVILAAEKSPLCTYKPDYRNDGYKECSSELIIWNRGDSSISLDMVEENFGFAITEPYKEGSLGLSYSIDYEISKEERNNLTSGELYNVSKVGFNDWKPLDGSTKNLQSDEILGIKFEFEFPQYEEASYNITYKPLNWLLDPDITNCGALSTAGATYTLASGFSIGSSRNTCFDIVAENITFDGGGASVFITLSMGVSVNQIVNSSQFNTTIKNFPAVISSGGTVINAMINLESGADNSTIISNTIASYNPPTALKASDVDYLTIFNNTITEPSVMIGIYLLNSNHNNITNNKIYNATNYSIIFNNSHNNTITNIKIDTDTDTGNDGSVIINSSSDNLIQHGNLITNQTKIVTFIGSSTNNTFLNVSYSAKENVAVGGQLIRKWYFDAQVNYTHNSSAAQGTNVSAYNTTGDLHFSVLSAADGSITQQQLIQYINTSTTAYYTNYTINASLIGWDTDSEKINITENLLQQFNMADTTNPLISYGANIEINNSNVTVSHIFTNVTVTEANEKNITFLLHNQTAQANSTTFTDGTRTINWTGLSDDRYTYNVTVYDYDGNSNTTLTRTITLDSTSPIVTIAHPQSGVSYLNNESIPLNYTVTDPLVGIDSCWYDVYNSTGDEVIANTTIANCINTTFALPGGDIDYNLTLYSNDSLNNVNSSIVEFGVRTLHPAINLDAPTNYQNLSNGNNTYFNFTATDVDGLDTCQLWGNWTGTWHKNYTWVGPTSGAQNYTTQNISEGRFKWGVWCNDTLDTGGWSIYNFTFTVDETIPNVTITTANNTQVTDTLSITIDYNISDINIDSCYFTLRTTGGLVHNYPENTSLNCASTSRSISTLWYGTFVVQFWGEDYAGNLDDANLTFITYFSGGGPGGGNGEPIVEEEEEEVPRSFCGDGICQTPNDYDVMEDFWNCPIDCPGFDFDALIYSFTKYCFDGDPSTICFFTDQLFATVPGMGEEIVKDKTVYKDGQVCIGEICERLSGKTLFSNCVDADPTTPCFWKSNFAFFVLFLGGSTAFALTFVRVRVSGRREKVNPYRYLQLKVKGRKKRKWR